MAPQWRFSWGRAALAFVLALIGSLVVLTAYANPAIVPDIPLITTRGDVAVQMRALQQQAVAAAPMPGPAGAERARTPFPSGTLARSAARLLAMQPLSSQALLFAQFDPRFARSAGQRSRISDAALRADPRSRQVRAMQILTAAQQRDFAAALAGLERMVEIAPNDSEAVIPIAVLLTNDAAARGALMERLRTPRPWHARLAAPLMQARMPIPQMVAFGELLMRNPDPSARQAVLGGLINRRAYADARRLWLASLPAEQRSITGNVHGSRFPQNSLGYPFGWTLTQEGSDGADLADPDGVVIRYSGRSAMTYASQLLVLRPGGYRLDVRGVRGAPEGSGLSWTLRCKPSEAVIATIDLGTVVPAGGAATVAFTVGSGCEAQQLALGIARSEFPDNRELQIAAVEVTPAR